jgi:hypothetical protein
MEVIPPFFYGFDVIFGGGPQRDSPAFSREAAARRSQTNENTGDEARPIEDIPECMDIEWK